MNRHHLVLTDEETALFEDIDFAPHLKSENQRSACQANE